MQNRWQAFQSLWQLKLVIAAAQLLLFIADKKSFTTIHCGLQGSVLVCSLLLAAPQERTIIKELLQENIE